MQQYSNQETPESYSSILKDITTSSAQLLRSEIRLVKEEVAATSSRLASHSRKALLGLVLLMMSLPPFVAFLVIGLGNILDGRYWLSAILVSLTLAASGSALVYATLRKLKGEDLWLPATRQSLEREAEVISTNLDNVRNATKRRAV